MRNLFFIFAASFFSFVLTASIINAQTPINGGVLNGKAVQLVKPDYPAAAKAVKAGGTVNIQITIDENGSVTSAKAVSGHALLRKASEEAALKSKFSPTYLGGKVVKVSGVLVYNFVPEAQNTEPSISLKDETDKNIVNGGVVNGKAINLSTPEYPAAAKAVKADGSVNVQVIIDEEGKVTKATAISGHALLLKSAENAAMSSTFSPTYLNSKPVKVSGIIIYQFSSSPEKNIQRDIMKEKAIYLPQPPYPANADKSKDSGDVRVQISVDEDGNVLSAKAVSGNPVFYEVSEKAAKEAKFEPTLLDGKKVRVTGFITYRFVPDNK